jgi:hypothetical protein
MRLRLRTERQGNGDGRVNLILAESTDSSGNRGINCCTVVVLHSRSKQALASVQAQAAAAQAFCLANEGMPPAGYFVVGVMDRSSVRSSRPTEVTSAPSR